MPEQIVAARHQGLSALRDRGERWCEKLERRPYLIAACLAAVYVVMLFSPIQRRLWYDELFTYHISQAPGLDRFIDEVRKLDLNPPLIYVVTRAWWSLAGNNEAVLRIPMAVAYFGASLGFFAFLRRRVGALWACVSVLLFWSSQYFVFATELRPYALLLAFFSLTVLSWDSGARAQPRPIAWAGIVLGGLGMMFSHVFAIFSLGAIYLAELVRTYRNRRIDWPMWSALLLPLISIVTYFRMTQTFEASLFPPIFQGGVRRLAIFFARLGIAIGVQFALASLAAFLAAPSRDLSLRKRIRSIRPEDVGLASGLLIIPFLVNAMLMRSHGAFFDRYCITTAAAIPVLGIVVLAAFTKFSRFAAVCAALVILAAGLRANVLESLKHRHELKGSAQSAVDALPRDLPVVAASGIAFLEMDHYEPKDFLSRLYYLTDRKSAIKYAHATMFEGLPVLTEYFPIRAHVMPYSDFVAEHRQFLVFGNIGFPEDWLLRKLLAEGASVRHVKDDYTMPYRDASIYEVSIKER